MANRSGDLGRFELDPETGTMAEIRSIQPYQAVKAYLCPGCNQEIRPGTGHVVVVPLTDPGARRHWHRPCFERHGRQRQGRR